MARVRYIISYLMTIYAPVEVARLAVVVIVTEVTAVIQLVVVLFTK